MRHSSTCVDNTIIYLGIQYSRKCALGTPWIFVILAIWTSTWIIFLSRASPNKRGFQSYNKRFAFFFSFKGSYRGFIALKEIQIRFATVQILNRGGSAAMWWREAEGGGRASEWRVCCAESPPDGSRGLHLAPCSLSCLFDLHALRTQMGKTLLKASIWRKKKKSLRSNYHWFAELSAIVFFLLYLIRQELECNQRHGSSFLLNKRFIKMYTNFRLL